VKKTPIELLFNQKVPSKTLEKLLNTQLNYQEDLLWIFPLRVYRAPRKSSFLTAEENQFFKGSGKIISRKISPSYAGKGKRGIRLFNINLLIKDHLSDEFLNLVWFNSYPNIQKMVKEMEEIAFEGLVTINRTQKQVVTPKLLSSEELNSVSDDTIREYPTVNTIPGKTIRQLIDKVAMSVFDSLTSFHENTLPLSECFKVLHGLSEKSLDRSLVDLARKEIIYHEFFLDQIKIMARKRSLKQKTAQVFHFDTDMVKKATDLHSFAFTVDQTLALNDILIDLKSGSPMMRMIQGDVGCGKTAVAITLSCLIMQKNGQVAFMCPTETLARQHFISFQKCFAHFDFKIHLLLGSSKKKERDIISTDIMNNDKTIVIGTHTLFQESIEFKNLQLAIIDEQHKFGVEQRLKLVNKGNGTHCLIMTATPIPRTLSLTQYGDLDLTTIRSIPLGRKGIKTRIVEPVNMQNYYSFLKTRLDLHEQAFVVVPAIEENEKSTLENVQNVFEQYKTLFNTQRIDFLHGKMKSDDKDRVITMFAKKEIDILVSTSVIEVGINIPEATVIAIYNPDRFGLSSLHQLRGRVGRGEKTGFCFLVSSDNLPASSKQRLQVMEETVDGFIIAEKDLEFRGQGDLFGKEQSGITSNYKVADIFTHRELFEQVTRDLSLIQHKHPAIIDLHIQNLLSDDKITSTI